MKSNPVQTVTNNQQIADPTSSLFDGEENGDPDPSLYLDSEQQLISGLFKLFQSDKKYGRLVDYSDDCAFLPPDLFPSGLLLSCDALIEGVHFDRRWDSFFQIGAQAAVVNLSDIAGSGGVAQALMWSLSLPPSISQAEVQELAQGFKSVADPFGVAVIGGNITTRSGGLEVHVTAIGNTSLKPVTRQGAQVGDRVYVTGTLGTRALGYLEPTLSSRQIRHEWYPHLAEAKIISTWGHVTAMMDISDGLLLDTQRLAKLNHLHISIHTDKLPIDRRLNQHPLIHEAALNGGEDYILLFTAPATQKPPLGIGAVHIGDCLEIDHNQDNIWISTNGKLPSLLGHSSWINE